MPNRRRWWGYLTWALLFAALHFYWALGGAAGLGFLSRNRTGFQAASRFVLAGLIDLAVREDYRKRGIGRALLDVLLASRQEQRATLTMQPVATDTKEFYEHLGWQRIGTTKAPDGAVSPFFDVYLLQIHAKP